MQSLYDDDFKVVDNIVEELGLVGVDVVACVGNHLQLDPDPENRCQGDSHAGGQGEHTVY